MKPLLFVTGHLPAYRVGAFAALHEGEGIEVALFGGRRRRRRHGGPEQPGGAGRQDGDGGGAGAPERPGELPFPCREAGPRELYTLARRGAYRAVVCSTAGRAALLATWAGARRGGIPVILWASLWAHPRTPAHLLSYLPLRRLYRSADAVVTYGPHVSAYVRERGAGNVYVAPQSVDNDFWASAQAHPRSLPARASGEQTRFLFVGRAASEKGLEVLLAAWAQTGLEPPAASLLLVGGRGRHDGTGGWGVHAGHPGVFSLGELSPPALRDVYAAADVLVVPSIETRAFREPWGLVVNEAMDRGLAVIASDAVGAAAGGLVRDGETGLVVPAADPEALAAAISRLAASAQLREGLGEAGVRAVAPYTYEAWAQGFSQALASLGLTATRARW